MIIYCDSQSDKLNGKPVMFAWKRPLTVKSQIWHSFEIENKSKNNIDEFIVQDLPREKFCNAVDHMVEHFLTDEPICKTKQIRNDKVALNEVCNLWKNVLEQNLVLVCYKKGSDEIIGLNMLCHMA
ncbi:CLUMA_CG020594, isoform A [Clunio marinus]|uniref:CLUMA_CG020594, isoform A n=1 Tax=Clunio marinus TaxID=568069 RepID=A0A1J1J821_9DIPT|nr:CLUMA_CG020594, isoform A [Clunio marinus]